MKKILLGILSILIASNVHATSGRTNSQGCHNSKKIGYHCHGSPSISTSTSTSLDNIKAKINIGDKKELFELSIEKEINYKIINPEKYNLFKNVYLDFDNGLVSKIISYEEMDNEKCENYLLNEESKALKASKLENMLVIDNNNPIFFKCSNGYIFFIQK